MKKVNDNKITSDDKVTSAKSPKNYGAIGADSSNGKTGYGNGDKNPGM